MSFLSHALFNLTTSFWVPQKIGMMNQFLWAGWNGSNFSKPLPAGIYNVFVSYFLKDVMVVFFSVHVCEMHAFFFAEKLVIEKSIVDKITLFSLLNLYLCVLHTQETKKVAIIIRSSINLTVW